MNDSAELTRPGHGSVLKPEYQKKYEPVILYLFNEGHGSVAHDLSNYQNNGVFSNKNQFSQRRQYFAQDLSFIEVTNKPILNFTSFSIFVRLKIVPVNNIVQNIVSKRDSGGGWAKGFTLAMEGANLKFKVNSTANQVTYNPSIVSNLFTLCAVYSNKQHSLYLNNEKVASKAGGSLVNSNSNLELFRDQTILTFLEGFVEDIMICKKALSDGDIERLHNEPYHHIESR